MNKFDGAGLRRTYPLSMKLTGLLACIGFLAMSAAIVRGFLLGDFSGEGRLLLSLIWGQVSLLDVYLGFLIFSGWILYREGVSLSFVVWFLLMMVFGNATASFYVLRALFKSGGDWRAFWLGKAIHAGSR
jgi:hypothetical protein